MTARVYAFNCGWQTGPLGNFLAGLAGRIRVPTPAYLIVHPRGRVLFDSGLHAEARVDPAARLGVIARVYDIEATAADGIAARLGEADVDVARVDLLVNSHLHYDHCGGNHAVPNARLVVQRREWEAGHDAEQIRANYYTPGDYDCGHDVWLADGELDLFGDGTVVCVPTPGHTPGHQSLRVRTAAGELLLAADCCYLRRTLDDLHLPGILHDAEAALASLARLRRLRDAGTRIFYGHDPEFWAGVPQAPAAVA